MPFTLVGGRTYSDPSQKPNTGFPVGLSSDYLQTFGIELLQGRTFCSAGHGDQRPCRDG